MPNPKPTVKPRFAFYASHKLLPNLQVKNTGPRLQKFRGTVRGHSVHVGSDTGQGVLPCSLICRLDQLDLKADD